MSLHKRIVPALLASLVYKGHKMLNNFLGFNRGIIVANIAIINGAGNDFRKLVDDLTLPELKILKHDEDLIQRTKDILKLDAEGLREYMVRTWGLLVESCQNDDWWCDVEGIRDRCPDWSRAIIEGHYIDSNDFVKWAQRWLMQEVRVNINIKRIEELRAAAKKRKEDQQKELEDQYPEVRKHGMCDMTYL